MMKSICFAAIAFLTAATVPAMAQHSYPAAKILTASGKEVVLTDVSISRDAQKIGYLSYATGEIGDIFYRPHTNLGPEFTGKAEHFYLYQGENAIYFRNITSNAKGDVLSIQFINHAELSSKDVDIEITGPGYTGDPWVFHGKSGSQEVLIRGSKIKTITFEGVPPQTAFDKR